MLKEKRFLKFLIISERWRTTANGNESSRTATKARERLRKLANGCEISRTAICRSFFEVTDGQDKLFDENKIEYVLKKQYAYKLTPRTKNVTPNDAIIVNNCVL
jgi:hypothetical protein